MCDSRDILELLYQRDQIYSVWFTFVFIGPKLMMTACIWSMVFSGFRIAPDTIFVSIALLMALQYPIFFECFAAAALTPMTLVSIDRAQVGGT